MLPACHKKSNLTRSWSLKSRILRNISLFSSSCLCPLDCLSFVHWKINISRYLTSRFCQTAFLMTCQQHPERKYEIKKIRFMSLVAHQFGRVKFWNLVLIFKVRLPEEIIHKYSKFPIRQVQSMSYQGHKFHKIFLKNTIVQYHD